MSEPTRLIQRIKAEYETVPGLKLTRAQAARLWSAPEEECDRAFEALVAQRFLWRAPSGRYVALPAPEGEAVQSLPTMARCPHCKKRNPFQRDATIHGRDVTVTLRCVACQRVFSFSTCAA